MLSRPMVTDARLLYFTCQLYFIYLTNTSLALTVCNVLNTTLSALVIWIYLIFTTTPGVMCYYYPLLHMKELNQKS